MKVLPAAATRLLGRISADYLPFADAATAELPLGRLARLGLFQLSVGMATTLLAGTLNRVMIVELHVSATLVSLVIGLPLLLAPFRALIGFRSDVYESVLGWRRVPFLWFGTLLQFGGLAIMPFALILLSGDSHAPAAVGRFATAFAFLLVGAGAHTTQTAGLALATDLAPEESRPRVVALLYLMLLAGMVVSSLVLGALLHHFTQIRLIQLVQGAAVLTMALNLTALWKQEPRAARRPMSAAAAAPAPRPRFRDAWRVFTTGGRAVRLLVAVAIGSVGFSMQDALLEPYGGQILGMSVGGTTGLTALIALGAILAFGLSARSLGAGGDPLRLAALGAVAGVVGFSFVIFAAPLASTTLFCAGAAVIGFGDGLFSVGTLTAAMGLRDTPQHGLALGAWGAVIATSEGGGLALGGVLRDGIAHLADRGLLGSAMHGASVPYSTVYHLEIALLFASLVALGPLVAPLGAARRPAARFGMVEL